jgi:hypothetical protein
VIVELNNDMFFVTRQNCTQPELRMFYLSALRKYWSNCHYNYKIANLIKNVELWNSVRFRARSVLSCHVLGEDFSMGFGVFCIIHASAKVKRDKRG